MSTLAKLQRGFILKSSSGTLALSILFYATSAYAEFSTFHDVQASFAKVSNVESSNSQDQKELYVVSDEELTKYSNSAEMIREIKILKQEKAVLLDYSKKIREKYKALESYYATRVTDGSLQDQQRDKNTDTDLHILKQENMKLYQDNQNLKTEYDALKLQEKATQEHLSQLKEKYKNIDNSMSDLKNSLEKKKSETQICLSDLDRSQKIASKVPELEKEMVSLKNELILKRSAAELLAGHVSSPKVVASQEMKNDIAVAVPQKPISAAIEREKLNADVMVVEVAADKVALRAGPGMNNSPIMDIGKGARLTVEAREGEWLRVNAPTGGRAYILAKYVKTLDGGTPKLDKPLKRASLNSEVVPFGPEVTKPPLPQKPVKRSARASIKSEGDSISQEAAALEALKKAMSENVGAQ